jgi:hypothetical protein
MYVCVCVCVCVCVYPDTAEPEATAVAFKYRKFFTNSTHISVRPQIFQYTPKNVKVGLLYTA